MEQIRAEMRDQPWMLPAIDHSAVPIDLVRSEPKAGYYRVFSKQNFAAEDLNESIDLADNYIGKTIDCYYSSYYNTYSLNNDLDTGAIYSMIAFVGLCVCILSVCTIQYCKKKRNDNTNNKKLQNYENSINYS